MHNSFVFCTFSTFAQKIRKGWGCNFTCSFGKVMRIKSLKMMFVAKVIRHELCMIYAFFDFFCSKIIFDQKLFSYCLEKFDYPGSIVYLSCSALRNQSFWEHCKRSPIITSARVFWKNLNGGLIRESDRYPHFLGVYE